MAYATSDDLIARFDATYIADLASDTGEPLPIDQLSGSSKIDVALEDASGQIDAALSVARQYEVADLLLLTGSPLGLLKRLVCQLAMVFLMERRQENLGSERLQDLKKTVEKYLDALRQGDRIFGIDANMDASLPELDGPTTTNYDDMNLMATTRVRNFYPAVGKRLPRGRSFENYD
jgi:phage gp36-like protein